MNFKISINILLVLFFISNTTNAASDTDSIGGKTLTVLDSSVNQTPICDSSKMIKFIDRGFGNLPVFKVDTMILTNAQLNDFLLKQPESRAQVIQAKKYANVALITMLAGLPLLVISTVLQIQEKEPITYFPFTISGGCLELIGLSFMSKKGQYYQAAMDNYNTSACKKKQGF